MPPIPTSPTTRLGRLIAIAALALAACSGNDDGTATPATTPAEPTTTTTTTAPTPTPIDVATVPDEITVEYVQAVMDELDRAWGDMFRLFHAEGGPTQETWDRLEALYAEPGMQGMRDYLGVLAADQFPGIRTEPGDPETQVRRLLVSSSGCVFAEVGRHFNAIIEGSPTGFRPNWLGLVQGADVPNAYNATVWKIILDGGGRDGEAPENPCEQ
jgi:hypothetical protein